jgi:2-isopropylmalate synthase
VNSYAKYVLKPDVRKTSEIRHHYDNAPGLRYVFMDQKKCPDSSMYTIVRAVKGLQENTQDSYIDPHTHSCDSEFLFIGDHDDLTGLRARVWLGGEEFLVDSPAAVFIPAGVEHNVQLVSGSGKFLNILPTPDYNKSLK